MSGALGSPRHQIGGCTARAEHRIPQPVPTPRGSPALSQTGRGRCVRLRETLREHEAAFGRRRESTEIGSLTFPRESSLGHDKCYRRRLRRICHRTNALPMPSSNRTRRPATIFRKYCISTRTRDLLWMNCSQGASRVEKIDFLEYARKRKRPRCVTAGPPRGLGRTPYMLAQLRLARGVPVRHEITQNAA